MLVNENISHVCIVKGGIDAARVEKPNVLRRGS